jgi:hypothetical protein
LTDDPTAVPTHSFLDNLFGIHGYEEELRTQSITLISAHANLLDHFEMIEGALDIIQLLGKHHPQRNEDELTIQKLGIRLFNTGTSSLKLGLSGFYQTAFLVARDLLETSNLLDYLLMRPNHVQVWREADEKTLKSLFSPAAIRIALDRRDGFTTKGREVRYKEYCAYAAHPTFKGLSMLVPQDTKLHTYGPFFDPGLLKAVLEELATHLCHSAVIFNCHFDDVSEQLLDAKAHYLQLAEGWRQKYLAADVVVTA